MNQAGERENSTVIPSFNGTIRIDFRGAKISSDTGILMLREIDQRFNITAPLGNSLDDPRRASHLRHTYVDLIRQRAVPQLSRHDMFDDGFTAIARDGAGAIEIEVRLQKAFTSLASIGHAAMRDAAIRHARLALTRAENVMELPADLEIVRKLANSDSSVPTG